ncbi:carbamoyl-phosphate synthase small subunit, partial [mine drainage metagenome]
MEGFLVQHRVPAIVGIDTRRLTRHLRRHGALPGAFGHADRVTVAAAARTARGTDGTDLVSRVTTRETYQHGDGARHVVALDYGIKTTMVHQLARRFRVTVVPATFDAEDIRALAPDGLFLSNGPGDPAALDAQVRVLDQLIGTVPIFGICLGH